VNVVFNDGVIVNVNELFDLVECLREATGELVSALFNEKRYIELTEKNSLFLTGTFRRLTDTFKFELSTSEHALRTTEKKDSSVKEDRLYSLLGLFKWGSKVEINYSRAIGDILCEIAEIAVSHGDLSCL